MTRAALLSALDGRARQLATAVDQVHHCDALTLLRALPDGYVDLVVTSPPYDHLRRYNGFLFSFEPTALELYRVLKPGGVCVWVIGDSVINGSETLNSMRQALYFVDIAGFKMHDTMIYHRPGVVFPETVRYYQQFEYMFVLAKNKPKVFNALREKTNWGGLVREVLSVTATTGTKLLEKMFNS